MRHERLKVLELLEAGKITATEAASLLEAMKKTDRMGANFGFDDETREQMEDRLGRFSSQVDNFTRDFGGKVEHLYRDLEPRIKKASQAVLEKTAAIFDEISRSLNESLENARKSAESACHEEKEDICGCGCGCESGANSDDDDTPKPN